jgi:hypothetical protein
MAVKRRDFSSSMAACLLPLHRGLNARAGRLSLEEAGRTKHHPAQCSCIVPATQVVQETLQWPYIWMLGLAQCEIHHPQEAQVPAAHLNGHLV